MGIDLTNEKEEVICKSPAECDASIQKDENKVKELIHIVKVRLWLRVFYHHELHTKSPRELVDLGLMDPVPLFVKNEGHGEKKQKTKRWRLIWNASQIDTSIEMYLHQSFNKTLIASYQDGSLNTTPPHLSELTHPSACFAAQTTRPSISSTPQPTTERGVTIWSWQHQSRHTSMRWFPIPPGHTMGELNPLNVLVWLTEYTLDNH